jgi:hypothetical protein
MLQSPDVFLIVEKWKLHDRSPLADAPDSDTAEAPVVELQERLRETRGAGQSGG